jgi:ligand-binding sensor protein
MFIAELFTMAKIWNQAWCSSTDEWIKKMWLIYMMKLYSAIKENEIMSLAGKWVELEVIMLSEISPWGQKRQESKRSTSRCVESKNGKGGGEESDRGDEYDQGTLYTCMEMS